MAQWENGSTECTAKLPTLEIITFRNSQDLHLHFDLASEWWKKTPNWCSAIIFILPLICFSFQPQKKYLDYYCNRSVSAHTQHYVRQCHLVARSATSEVFLRFNFYLDNRNWNIKWAWEVKIFSSIMKNASIFSLRLWRWQIYYSSLLIIISKYTYICS